MWAKYEDITSRLGEPLWWDERGVPRYAPFARGMAADIYAAEIALVEIQCQACMRRFRVAFSLSASRRLLSPDIPTLAHQIEKDMLHYGDPPHHDGCIGESMNCNDLRVLEFWSKGSDFEWERVPELEIGLGREASAPG